MHGGKKSFKCVPDEEVFGKLYTSNNFLNLNKRMLKQNIEADFETDEEQIQKATQMMKVELLSSVTYCVSHNPYSLVTNIRRFQNAEYN